MPGRQQTIESIRDRIRWAVWTVVVTGNDCNRFEIDPIWTQSGFKPNRTNLNRSQSIYMWTRSKSSYIIEVSLLSQESERSCICVLGVSSQESERSCICVLGVSSQECERSCICVLGASSQESERSCICVLGVSSQESERSCICVLGVSILSLSEIFFIGFRNSSVNEVIFVFHLLHPSHHKYKSCIWFVVRNQQLPLPVSLYRVAEKPDSVSSHNIHSFNWKDYALYDFTYNCQHWTWSIGFKT